MSTFRDLVRKASDRKTNDSVVVYATAITDSENGEVLVRFDNDIPEEDEYNTVDLEEFDTIDAIDYDSQAEELGPDDAVDDISEDDVLEETYDGGISDE